MDIGIPKEIKIGEGRVGLLPAQVRELSAAGHRVHVQQGAGRGAQADDDSYASAGANMLANGAAVFAAAQLIVKVKEILPAEFGLLRREHILLTNIHSAADRPQLDRLLEVGLAAIAAEETHQFGSPNGPLAGEVGALEGVRLTLATHGGGGRHFMQHFDSPPTRALVLGLGAAGRGALRVLLGLGLEVVGFDIDERARREAELHWHAARYRSAPVESLPGHLHDADLLINCVKWDKTRQDHLLSRAQLSCMKPDASIVDVACDRNGAIETSRPTTWDDPCFVVDGIRHFCVDNLPGAVPVASSAGYAAALLPKVRLLADRGVVQACRADPWLARGLTCLDGRLTLAEAARVQNRDWTPAEELLAAH